MGNRDLISTLNKKNKKIDKKKPIAIPEYGVGGVIERTPKKSKKPLLIFVIIIGILACAIYSPAIIASFGEQDTGAGSYYVTPDISALKLSSDYLKDLPDNDFDDDGLTNVLETQYGTNPRKADTDKDGVTDYAELFTYNTDPTIKDSGLYEAFVANDKAQGNELNTPYKKNDVVLWASSYESKAYGCVVKTLNGYRFSNFTGWAEFPTGSYAYKIEDEKHVLLEKKEAENAWAIDGDYEVILKDEPLLMVNKLNITGIGVYYLDDNFIGNALETILPDKIGLITCEKVARDDTWVNADTIVTVPISKITYNENNLGRFGANRNSLSDLAEVYELLKNGESILVSLNSEAGEVISEIYGYDARGNLLLADKDTLEPVGTLTVEPKGRAVMDENGDIKQNEYFNFYGVGFDSRVRDDTIVFFAASVKDYDGEYQRKYQLNEAALTPSEPTTEPATDSTVENTESTPSEAVSEPNASSYNSQSNQNDGASIGQADGQSVQGNASLIGQPVNE